MGHEFACVVGIALRNYVETVMSCLLCVILVRTIINFFTQACCQDIMTCLETSRYVIFGKQGINSYRLKILRLFLGPILS